MKDLFGVEITEQDYMSVPKKYLSLYQRTKLEIGYRKATELGKNCGKCENHIITEYHDKIYHKCSFIGISSSEATDIRVSYVCKRFEL